MMIVHPVGQHRLDAVEDRTRHDVVREAALDQETSLPWLVID
jgi:hypothetical protein